MWFTWANLLTVLRLASIGPCAYAVVTAHWQWAGGLFVLAVATDLLDGVVARRFNHASALGGLLDHSTDALFVVVLFVALAYQNHVPYLLPGLVAAAFIQYMLDSRSLDGRRLRTSWLGRGNGIAYFVVIGTVLIRNALELTWPADIWIERLAWLLIATSLISIFDRARVWLVTAK
jgi:phosphatidylglycerophosphate synthase